MADKPLPDLSWERDYLAPALVTCIDRELVLEWSPRRRNRLRISGSKGYTEDIISEKLFKCRMNEDKQIRALAYLSIARHPRASADVQCGVEFELSRFLSNVRSYRKWVSEGGLKAPWVPEDHNAYLKRVVENAFPEETFDPVTRTSSPR